MGKTFEALIKAEKEAENSKNRLSALEDESSPTEQNTNLKTIRAEKNGSILSQELKLLRKEFCDRAALKIKPKNKKNAVKFKRKLITLNSSESIISENFKMVRTRLLQSIKNKNLRTILVTSTLPCEGKTFAASNLAVSLARGLNTMFC